MTANVANRAVARKQFALLLRTALVTEDGVVAAVYDYQVDDFKGESPVVVVTGSGSQRGTSITSEGSDFFLEVHNFVLYGVPPIRLAEDLEADTEVIVPMTDTSLFHVGDEILVEDASGSETAIVNDVVDGESITLDELASSYTEPSIYAWTAAQSEDMIDYLEKRVADIVVDANASDLWLGSEHSDRTEIDVIEVGGEAYRHEVISVRLFFQDTFE